MIYEAEVKLCPPSKSNSYRFSKSGRVYKTKEVKAFEHFFSLCLPAQIKKLNISTKFRLEYDVYLRNKAQDLDNTSKAILDSLQAAGAIKNDSLCYELEIRKFIDKDNPRIKLKLIIL